MDATQMSRKSQSIRQGVMMAVAMGRDHKGINGPVSLGDLGGELVLGDSTEVLVKFENGGKLDLVRSSRKALKKRLWNGWRGGVW